MSSKADIAIYGGSAGGGKTFALLLEALRHVKVNGFTAAIFRRTKPQIKKPGGPWQESLKMYAGQVLVPTCWSCPWRFPSGARIEFHHLQYEQDTAAWLGAQVALLCFDQLETFTEGQFWDMLARNRSASEVVPYVRATQS